VTLEGTDIRRSGVTRLCRLSESPKDGEFGPFTVRWRKPGKIEIRKSKDILRNHVRLAHEDGWCMHVVIHADVYFARSLGYSAVLRTVHDVRHTSRSAGPRLEFSFKFRP